MQVEMTNSHTQALGLKILLRLYFNGENCIWMVNDKINFRTTRWRRPIIRGQPLRHELLTYVLLSKGSLELSK